MADNINVTIEESQPINVCLQGYSFLEDISTALAEYLIQETPTKVTTKRFQTSQPYVSTHLKVFFNGIKEKHITEISDTEFEFDIDTETEDIVEVEYIKKKT